jgi:tRNA:m4X modification enzyme
MQESGEQHAVEQSEPIKRQRLSVAKEVDIEALLASWPRCKHFLKKKMRACNFNRIPGSDYCGQHRPADDPSIPTNAAATGLSYDRVPCPLDPAHDVYRHKLESHLRVCTAKRVRDMQSALPYFRSNCNSRASAHCAVSKTRTSAITEHAIDPEVLLVKIKQAFKSYIEENMQELTSLQSCEWFDATKHSLEESIAQSQYNQKHLQQDIAIVEQMIRYELIRPPSNHESEAVSDNLAYVDFGAGRGLLGNVISSFLPTAPIILLERAGVRKKADRTLRESDRTFHRIRMDIRDCYLPAVTDALGLKTSAGVSPNIAITAKHLCGCATDFALTALESFDQAVVAGDERAEAKAACTGPRLHGYAIATCCHHACSWEEYVGASWFESIGFNADEFEIIAAWTGWQSICRTCESRQPKTSSSKEDAPLAHEADNSEDHSNALEAVPVVRPKDISSDEMVQIGSMSKRLIDQGRVQYLLQNGYQACQQQYCNPDYSPECFMIIATKPR